MASNAEVAIVTAWREEMRPLEGEGEGLFQ